MNKATSLIMASLLAVSAATAMADQALDSSSGNPASGSRSRMDNSATGSRGGDAAVMNAGGQSGASVNATTGDSSTGANTDTGNGPSAGSGPKPGKSYDPGTRKNTGKTPGAGAGTGTGSTSGSTSDAR